MYAIDGDDKGIQAEVVRIDPKAASRWLEQNTNNRQLSKSRIDTYAAAMIRGEWRLNGDPIRFSIDGRLIDGQHRLTACVRAGVGFESLVVRGLEDAAQGTIDRGKPRTIGDHLEFLGEKNARNLAGGIRTLYQFEQSGYEVQAGLLANPTVDQAVDVLDRHPGLRAFALEGYKFARVGGRGSYWISLSYLFHQIDPELAEFFRDGFQQGTNLTEEDAVLHLRNKLIADKGRAQSRIPFKVILALKIKAWNMTVDASPCSADRMRWRAVGPNAESWPALAGGEKFRR